MSSGKYIVEMLSSVALQIRSADNQQSAVILAYAGVRAERFKGSNLVFTHYDENYFLSTVRWEEGVIRELPKARLEIQAAKNLKPQRLEVSAAR